MGPVIYLYGPSGAGTTTLGRTLAAELGWRHMDTDDYFWKPTDPPYTVKRPIERRLELMEKELDREAVGTVLSGALDGWGDPLIPRFSLAVRLEVDAERPAGMAAGQRTGRLWGTHPPRGRYA